MKLDHYRNYIAIVEEGTLLAASRRMHIAQPALSNQIKAMERAFGAQLFIRNPRSMEPTTAGKILYEKAKHIVLLEDSAEREISASLGGFSGTLTIGITQSYPDPFVNDLFHRFHVDNPNVKFEIFELTSTEVMEMIKNGIIELGIIRIFRELPAYLQRIYAFPERLMAVGRKDAFWFPLEHEIDIERLKDVPLALSRGFQKPIMDECLAHNFVPNVISVSTSRNNALLWAYHGDAVAVVTLSDPGIYENHTVFCRPLTGDMASSRVIVSRRGEKLSMIAQRFAEYAMGEEEKEAAKE